jgi:hypothetical protein
VAIGWYNGWNGEERLAVLPIIKAALAAGELDPPTRCSVCLASGSPDWRADNAVVFHDEDYSAPLSAYPVCKPCHKLIHLRFWRRAEWAAHLALHGRGGAWFEWLTLDPESRFRPFSGSYPAGLPASFDP